jgi:heparosan-N-sulfate-glucuronate 5-epimerase
MIRGIVRFALIVLLMLAVCAPAAHAAHGRYLDFGERPDFVDGQNVLIGPERVPQVRYAWGVEDNPVMVAHWALQHWSRTPRQPRATAIAAEWLVEHQRLDGAWEYLFDFNAAGLPMQAPWISAMAQGMGVSVLVRAYETTGRVRYLRVARRALRPFGRSVRRGGVTSRWDGLPWYEEYPGAESQHVLNGYEFALIGLHDLAPRSAAAGRLWRSGIRSLAARIAVFDLPEARTQYYAALGGGRYPVDPGYRHAHAILTQTLARLSGNRVLGKWAVRWGRWDSAALRRSRW